MLETIYLAIVAAAPSIVAIISIIAAIIKMIRANGKSAQDVIDKFEETRQAVLDTKEYETLKNELRMAHAENREIKKLIKELLTKIDRIERPEEKEEE